MIKYGRIQLGCSTYVFKICMIICRYATQVIRIPFDFIMDVNTNISPDVENIILSNLKINISETMVMHMFKNNHITILRKIIGNITKTLDMCWSNIVPYGNSEKNFNMIMDILNNPNIHIHILDQKVFMKYSEDNEFIPKIKYEMFKYIISRGKLDPTKDFNSAICWAAHYGCTDIVKFLLANPAVDPTVGNNYPLRFAAENGHFDVVSLLLADNRINPSKGNNYLLNNANRFSYDEKQEYIIFSNYAIIKATRNNHKNIVQMLSRRISIHSIIQSERLPEIEKIISDEIYPRLFFISNIEMMPDVIYYIKLLFLFRV